MKKFKFRFSQINPTLLLMLAFIAIGCILNMLFTMSFDVLNDFHQISFLKPMREQSLISPYYYSVLLLLGINIILSTSLALLNGFTGLFTMGHAGFMAIGAYTAAYVVKSYLPTAAPMLQLFTALAVGSLSASLFGLCIGFAGLRLSGDYLGMVTLGFSEIIRVSLLNIEAVGGARGMTDIPQFINLGMVTLIALIVIILVKRIRDGRFVRA
ncbi:MAG: branched-chain amino acid ABC transporter permease, partial [Oligoflexia bacterium]|nr:branched-chain amino acid ABC transporter permease [Oligoflexia bacterium]